MREAIRLKECRSCVHFQADPERIEQLLGGLTSLSSAYGSVRGDDGFCLHHQWFCRASAVCAEFVPAFPGR